MNIPQGCALMRFCLTFNGKAQREKANSQKKCSFRFLVIFHYWCLKTLRVIDRRLNASIYHTALRLSCQQQLKFALTPNHVVSIKRRHTLLPARVRRLPPPRSPVAIRENTIFRSKSFSAVSAILTSTKSVMSGARCQLSIHAFPDTRSSAVSPKSAPQSPSSRPETLLQLAVWLTPTATATSVRPVSSSSART